MIVRRTAYGLTKAVIQSMNNHDIDRIKCQCKDEFSNILDSFFDSFTSRCEEHKDTGIPTLDEIENIWGQLSLETRELYSKMIGEAISNIDESEAISSKKENT